jgi:hypothetical protein
VLRTLLVHQEHWQSLGLLNFLQLASTPPAAAGEWEVDDALELQGQDWGEEGEEGEEEYGRCTLHVGLQRWKVLHRSLSGRVADCSDFWLHMQSLF